MQFLFNVQKFESLFYCKYFIRDLKIQETDFSTISFFTCNFLSEKVKTMQLRTVQTK